jgi:hypothetical protein
MSNFTDFEVRQIADEIEFYLQNHPNAADTIEGIEKWWLSSETEVSTLILQQALNYLCMKSILKSNDNLNGNIVYSSNRNDTEL